MVFCRLTPQCLFSSGLDIAAVLQMQLYPYVFRNQLFWGKKQNLIDNRADAGHTALVSALFGKVKECGNHILRLFHGTADDLQLLPILLVPDGQDISLHAGGFCAVPLPFNRSVPAKPVHIQRTGPLRSPR